MPDRRTHGGPSRPVFIPGGVTIKGSNGAAVADDNPLAVRQFNASPAIIATPYSTKSFTTSANDGVYGKVVIDLEALDHRGEFVFETLITTGAAAPGAEKTLTVRWGFATQGDITETQSDTLVNQSHVIALQNASVTPRYFTSDITIQKARYLYVALAKTATDGTLAATVRLVAI